MDVQKRGRGQLSIREEQKRFTRERLLDAAFEVFTERGFREATVDQITSRGGANRATFYLHFKDKVEVAAGLGRRIGSQAAREFQQLGELHSPTRVDVRNWVKHHLDFVAHNRLLSQMLNEASCAEPRFAAEYSIYLGRVADVMMNGYLDRWPEQERVTARTRIILLKMMIDRFSIQVVVHGVPFPGESPIDTLADIIWTEMFAGLPANSSSKKRD